MLSPTFFRSFFSITLVLLTLNACSKSGSSCTNNASGSLEGKDYCMVALGANYASTKLPDGNNVEKVRVDVSIPDIAESYVIDAQTNSFNNSPGGALHIQKFETNVNYFDNYAWPTIKDAVLVKKPGSFIFTKFDRVNRKMSGTFEFIYTVNFTSGNKDFNVKGEFTDVSF